MKRKRIKRKFFDLRYVRVERRKNVIFACIFFCSIWSFYWIHNYLLGSVVVRGVSMYPTLVEGEKAIMHRWVVMVRPPMRGDIVVVRDPIDKTLAVKRVIAVPGEEIEIKKDGVYINDNKIEEDYLPPYAETPSFQLGSNRYKVADDCYFVMGDNRTASEDSRSYGALTRDDVLGVVIRSHQ